MGEVRKDINTSDINWDEMSDDQLEVMERKIASKYMKIFPLGIIIWGFANTFIWLSLWPLVLMNILPLWIAFPIAVLNVCLAYLPSHDAQHSIIARKGHKLRWLNELLGHVSLIPFVAPFRYLRYTHFEHHNNANDPELDPDFDVHAKNRAEFFKKIILRKQPGQGAQKDRYIDALIRTNKTHVMKEAIIMRVAYMLILYVLAWSGYALEAALLWWVPMQVANIYIPYYLSWKPHHPGTEMGRYKDTNAFKSLLGNIGSSGMQYHVNHHLYPRIPLMHTPAAFRELRPILIRKGCDLRGL
jgi:beta-carotene hydroxylase